MAAEERGVRRSEILASARTSTELLMEEDARISIHEEQAIWREAIDRTGDPFLGVDVICNAPSGFLGFPELLFGSAHTLGEALDVACHYMPLVCDGVDVRGERDRDHVRLVYAASSPEGTSRMEDGAEAFLLAAAAVMGKRCAGRRLPIERLALSSKAPTTRRGLARLVDVFGTKRIEFGASEPSIVLHTSALGWPSLASAPRLHRALKEHADELLLERPGQGRFLSRAKRYLLSGEGQDQVCPPPSPLERAMRRLSPRQAQTLEHLCAGMCEKEIALALGISRNTVHTYVKAIYRVLGVSSRSELLVRCLSSPQARRSMT